MNIDDLRTISRGTNTDKQMDRQTDGQTDKKIDRHQTKRQTDIRQKDTHTDKHMDRHTGEFGIKGALNLFNFTPFCLKSIAQKSNIYFWFLVKVYFG